MKENEMKKENKCNPIKANFKNPIKVQKIKRDNEKCSNEHVQQQQQTNHVEEQ